MTDCFGCVWFDFVLFHCLVVITVCLGCLLDCCCLFNFGIAAACLVCVICCL